MKVIEIKRRSVYELRNIKEKIILGMCLAQFTLLCYEALFILRNYYEPLGRQFFDIAVIELVINVLLIVSLFLMKFWKKIKVKQKMQKIISLYVVLIPVAFFIALISNKTEPLFEEIPWEILLFSQSGMVKTIMLVSISVVLITGIVAMSNIFREENEALYYLDEIVANDVSIHNSLNKCYEQMENGTAEDKEHYESAIERLNEIGLMSKEIGIKLGMCKQELEKVK